MQLYTLNLAKAIMVNCEETASWPKLLADGALNPLNNEALLSWNSADIISDTPDGPRCARQLPPPKACGQTVAAGTPLTLEAGTYLFCQTRLAGVDSLCQAIEWFARETWWQGGRTNGPIFVRLIYEDGKTALQVLQASLPAQ